MESTPAREGLSSSASAPSSSSSCQEEEAHVPTNTDWTAKGTWRAKALDPSARQAKFEEHMRQLRSTREKLQAEMKGQWDAEPLQGIRRMPHMASLRFCTSTWPLRTSFLSVAGLPADFDLERLHSCCEGLGDASSSGLAAKRKLLAPFTDPLACQPFQQLFVDFMVSVVAPLFERETAATRLIFQAFPCIRISQPCHFPTIRPHIDRAYGHPWGSVNVWLPLTGCSSSNTLHIETSPGSEDFQPVELEYSQAVLGNMNECAHFTVSNSTQSTRVSLDFRVVTGECWEVCACSKVPFEIGRYYSECVREREGCWRVVQETQGYACSQHGFPHTRS